LPELPEVETICRALRSGGRDGPSILGWIIKKADVFWLKTLAEPSSGDFIKQITGQEVVDVRRRAKFIAIQLTDGYLVFHLRMSGDIRVEPDSIDISKHDRLVLWFENGFHLAFNDTRKFGRVWLVKDIKKISEKLGPEPLEISSPEEFHKRLIKYNRQLKPLLMDQRFLSGMGNIYTDEALHMAGLHPLQKSSELSLDQGKKLLAAIQEVLKKGIEQNGSSIDWIYRGGSFQNQFRVYGRGGQPCPVCGTLIKKIKVGQRGTHYCPTCQPDPRTNQTDEMKG